MDIMGNETHQEDDVENHHECLHACQGCHGLEGSDLHSSPNLLKTHSLTVVGASSAKSPEQKISLPLSR